MQLDKHNPQIITAFSSLEAQMEEAQREKEIPGLSVGIVYDQELIWSKGFGYANLEKKTPATPQTIFRIGSITKLFTATMLMQLRDRGELCLDDPITRYLPELKIRNPFSDSRPPTLRQIASHLAGLPREAPLDYWTTLRFPSIDEIIESLEDTELIFAPMSSPKYSNLGYAIMGAALERIARIPYKQYVFKNILQPLGMNNTGFDLNDDMETQLAIGYEIPTEDEEPKATPHFDLNGFTPAGQLYSSIEDIANFISLQFRDGPVDGSEILGGITLREMQSPVSIYPNWQGAIAIGWGMESFSKSTVLGHSGGLHGFIADMMLVPDIRLGVAVFTNTNVDARKISHSALQILIPAIKQARFHQQTPPSETDEANLEKYVGYYTIPGLAHVEVKAVDGKLKAIASEPYGQVTLVHETDHKFRMIDGPAIGETASFQLNSEGEIISLKVIGFTAYRMECQEYDDSDFRENRAKGTENTRWSKMFYLWPMVRALWSLGSHRIGRFFRSKS